MLGLWTTNEVNSYSDTVYVLVSKLQLKQRTSIHVLWYEIMKAIQDCLAEFWLSTVLLPVITTICQKRSSVDDSYWDIAKSYGIEVTSYSRCFMWNIWRDIQYMQYEYITGLSDLRSTQIKKTVVWAQRIVFFEFCLNFAQ